MTLFHTYNKVRDGLWFKFEVYQMDNGGIYITCDNDEVDHEIRHHFPTAYAAIWYIQQYEIPEYIYKDDIHYEMTGW